MNEKVLFDDPGWLNNYFPKVQKDLFVLFDYGWDLPVNRDVAEDISKHVKIDGNQIILSGELIEKIGLSASSEDDISDPGMVMKIESL